MTSKADSFVFSDKEQKLFDSVCDLHEQLDDILARVKNEIPPSRERSLVITKIQEADMWLARVPLASDSYLGKAHLGK